ncbi:MAG: glycerol-3-phosphate 1-O-acyltransferase PlsY [Candidatus Bipolaricaulota bacterium]
MTVVQYVIMALLGFLLGGIPTAYLAGRLRGMDIRRGGSGNVGGTNVLRLLGWQWGLPVMLLDAFKGYALVRWLPAMPIAQADPVHLALTGGIAAVLGHVFTPYLRFRGGKGVATAAGALLALAPWPTVIAAAVFLVVVFTTRFVSLGSLAAAGALPLGSFLLSRYTAVTVHPAVQWFAVGVAALVAWTHRANIHRLLTGTENRFRRR